MDDWGEEKNRAQSSSFTVTSDTVTLHSKRPFVYSDAFPNSQWCHCKICRLYRESDGPASTLNSFCQ